MSNKPGWKIIEDVANEVIKDPIAKAQALESARQMKEHEERSNREFVAKYLIAKSYDVV